MDHLTDISTSYEVLRRPRRYKKMAAYEAIGCEARNEVWLHRSWRIAEHVNFRYFAPFGFMCGLCRAQRFRSR